MARGEGRSARDAASRLALADCLGSRFSHEESGARGRRTSSGRFLAGAVHLPHRRPQPSRPLPLVLAGADGAAAPGRLFGVIGRAARRLRRAGGQLGARRAGRCSSRPDRSRSGDLRSALLAPTVEIAGRSASSVPRERAGVGPAGVRCKRAMGEATGRVGVARQSAAASGPAVARSVTVALDSGSPREVVRRMGSRHPGPAATDG